MPHFHGEKKYIKNLQTKKKGFYILLYACHVIHRYREAEKLMTRRKESKGKKTDNEEDFML